MRVKLSIPPGIVSDDTEYATDARYTDGNNVRFWRDKPQVIGGWTAALGSTLTGVCRAVLPWQDNSGVLNIAFGTHSKLQLYNDGTLYDITPSGLAAGNESGAPGPGFGTGAYDVGTYGSASGQTYYPRTWALDTWGQTLVAVPRGGTLYQWSNNTASLATVISQAPDNITTMRVVPNRRQLWALGCNEEVSNNINPLCIRGTDFEDLTDWTTSSTNNAFEYILEGSGRIVDSQPFGPYMAIWTDNAVYLATYQTAGANPWRFDLVAQGHGLMGPNAVQVVGSQAFWIGSDHQWRAWTIGGYPQIVPCPIRQDFFDNLDNDQEDKVIATAIQQYNEVWWFYPDMRDGSENSRYVALNTMTGAWFRGQLDRTAAMDAGAAEKPVMVTSDGYVYFHETGETANGAVLDYSLTSGPQYIGNGENFMLVRGVWPDIESQQGTVSLSILTRNYPQSTAVTNGPYSLTPSKERVDFLAQGRLVSFKVSGSAAPAFMRLGAPAFDVVPTGMQ